MGTLLWVDTYSKYYGNKERETCYYGNDEKETCYYGNEERETCYYGNARALKQTQDSRWWEQNNAVSKTESVASPPSPS